MQLKALKFRIGLNYRNWILIDGYGIQLIQHKSEHPKKFMACNRVFLFVVPHMRHKKSGYEELEAIF